MRLISTSYPNASGPRPPLPPEAREFQPARRRRHRRRGGAVQRPRPRVVPNLHPPEKPEAARVARRPRAVVAKLDVDEVRRGDAERREATAGIAIPEIARTRGPRPLA